MTIAIAPWRPASSPVPESGTTARCQRGRSPVHRAAVLEGERAPAALQRSGDALERDVAGRRLDRRTGGQHLSLAGAFGISLEAFVDRHPPERRFAALLRRQRDRERP